MGEADNRRRVWIDPVRRDSEQLRELAEELLGGDATPQTVDPHLLGDLLLAIHEDGHNARRTRLWPAAVALARALPPRTD